MEAFLSVFRCFLIRILSRDSSFGQRLICVHSRHVHTADLPWEPHSRLLVPSSHNERCSYFKNYIYYNININKNNAAADGVAGKDKRQAKHIQHYFAGNHFWQERNEQEPNQLVAYFD